MHANGVNIKYLGIIYKGLKVKYMKQLITNEIIARVFKHYFIK